MALHLSRAMQYRDIGADVITHSVAISTCGKEVVAIGDLVLQCCAAARLQAAHPWSHRPGPSRRAATADFAPGAGHEELRPRVVMDTLAAVISAWEGPAAAAGLTVAARNAVLAIVQGGISYNAALCA